MTLPTPEVIAAKIRPTVPAVSPLVFPPAPALPDAPATPNLYHLAQAVDGRLVLNRVMTRVMTQEEAINLACWLLHFADPELVAFQPVFRGIPKDAK